MQPPQRTMRPIQAFLRTLLLLSGALALIWSGQLAACTPNETPDGGTPDTTQRDNGGGGGTTFKACAEDKLVGGFRIQLDKDFTGVQGQVFTGVTPQNVPEVVERDGDCRLLRNKKLFCDPACKPGESCSDDGKCIATPGGYDVGKVEVKGMKAAVSMEPRAPIFFYTFTGTMPHPGFAAGDIITLSAAGGKDNAFTLKAAGIDALQLDTGGAKELEVSKDKDVELKWNAPQNADATKVDIRLNINNHGGAASWISCRVPDTGNFRIPKGLVTKLFDAGTSGFPDLQLSRQSIDSADLKVGCAQLVINSTVTIAVKVPGLTSCSDDNDCPDGQTCQGDLTCSE